MGNREFKNAGINASITGDNNNQKINKSNQNQIDKSVENYTDNSTHMTIYNVKYPDENDAVKDVFIKSSRTYLKEKYNIKMRSITRGDNPPEGLFTLYGYLQGNTVKSKPNLRKVLNVVDENGKYVADHICLDFKDEIYDDIYKDTMKNDCKLISFTGYADVYDKNKGIDYYVDIVGPVRFIQDIQENKIISVYKLNGEDLQRIYSYIMSEKCNRLYDIIDKLQTELNYLTPFYGTNFIFNYIINLYMLNTASDELYKTGIQRNRLTNTAIRDLIMLLGSTIHFIEKSDIVSLKRIFRHITFDCNVIQNIDNYFVKEYNNKFKNFCVSELGMENEDTIKSLWDIVINRKRNFGDETNPEELTKDVIAFNAFHVINKYIPREYL